MILFIIILGFSLVLFMIAHDTYHKAGKRKGNMILGVFMTEEGFRNKSARKIIKGYQVIWQWWEITAIMSLIPVLLVCKLYVSVGVFVFFIWCLLLLGGGQLIFNSFHRELYYLKQRNEWFYGKKLHLSIGAAQMEKMKKKRVLSDLSFIPIFLAGFIPLFYPKCREYLQKGNYHMLVVLFPFVIDLIILGCFYHFVRREYGKKKDGKIQTAYIRMEQCYWSYGWVWAGSFNAAANLMLQWNLISEERIFPVNIWSYILVQSVSVGILFYTWYRIKVKKKEIKSMDLQPKMVDDDEYWVQGYYDNPYDDRILVNDRIRIGSCINMGKSIGRKINFGSAMIMITGVLSILILLFQIDFMPFQIFIQGDKVSIQTGGYDLDVPISEIKTVMIKENLKGISYTKEDGKETERYLLGDFQIEGLGLCRTYVYKEKEEVLYIETEDKKIFFNTEKEEVVREVYERLKRD